MSTLNSGFRHHTYGIRQALSARQWVLPEGMTSFNEASCSHASEWVLLAYSVYGTFAWSAYYTLRLAVATPDVLLNKFTFTEQKLEIEWDYKYLDCWDSAGLHGGAGIPDILSGTGKYLFHNTEERENHITGFSVNKKDLPKPWEGQDFDEEYDDFEDFDNDQFFKPLPDAS